MAKVDRRKQVLLEIKVGFTLKEGSGSPVPPSSIRVILRFIIIVSPTRRRPADPPPLPSDAFICKLKPKSLQTTQSV